MCSCSWERGEREGWHRAATGPPADSQRMGWLAFKPTRVARFAQRGVSQSSSRARARSPRFHLRTAARHSRGGARRAGGANKMGARWGGAWRFGRGVPLAAALATLLLVVHGALQQRPNSQVRAGGGAF